MSSCQAFPAPKRKEGTGNPNPRRGQIKSKILKDVIKFFKANGHKEETKKKSSNSYFKSPANQ
ncbi:hypothetical protein HPP92_015060 [Vanilla planifolia]|uniref:Uncharacterized protein n=1 Tax=Vanilla planifolia TaxID=51239 RepID=A0A835UTQ0_VANPL|nr:hypothetical protein HPP92_015572 [Vanilla planifolia]KAG0475374.1 hypothetical protein HPP92_015060 [Vanilla planifolia]